MSAGHLDTGVLSDNRDEGCPRLFRSHPKTRRSPVCSFPMQSRLAGRHRPAEPCSVPSPFPHGCEQSEYGEAVSMGDLGFPGALDADLAHGRVEMLRAYDEAIEVSGGLDLG